MRPDPEVALDENFVGIADRWRTSPASPGLLGV